MSTKPAKLETLTQEPPSAPKDPPRGMSAFRVHLRMPPGDPRPPRWITMLAPGADLDEATRSAKARFVGRVIEVREGAA